MRLIRRVLAALLGVLLVLVPVSGAYALDCTAILREGNRTQTYIAAGQTELLYKIEIEQSAQIRLESAFSLGSSDYAHFQLEGPNGELYDLGDVHEWTNELVVDPVCLPVGNYYVRITFEPNNRSGSWLNIRYSTVPGSDYWGPLGYTYELEDNNELVSANSVDSARNIHGAVLNYQQSGRGLGYMDTDFYKVSLDEPGNVILDCWAFPDVEFALLDASGNQVRINAGSDNAPCLFVTEGDRGVTAYQVFNCGVLPAGDYCVRVSGKHTSTEGSSYRVILSQPQSMFSDVTASTPHVFDINWLFAEGISAGWDTGMGLEYRPYTEVARCDMAAFLYRLAGSPEFDPSSSDWSRFSDVGFSTPHAREILWMASAGIAAGFPDGSFKPYATVTRCDMAAFLRRMAGGSPLTESSSFLDVSDATPHAEDIMWLAGEGVSTGFPDGTFKPYGTVVRCDMAAFIHRMDGKIKL